jgi:hypothetical protein
MSNMKSSKLIFNNIDFANQYMQISKQFHYEISQGFAGYNIGEVISISKSIGYSMKYIKSEIFFKYSTKINDLKFQFNISLKHGAVELIWALWDSKELLKDFSGSWDVICERLGFKEPIRLPIFRDYSDLKNILISCFRIYEDFKTELLKEVH